MNATKSAEIFRHYDHFMQQQSDLSTCMELLERVHGDAYPEAFNEYEDITDFEARYGHDLSLFRRIGEQLSGFERTGDGVSLPVDPAQPRHRGGWRDQTAARRIEPPHRNP